MIYAIDGGANIGGYFMPGMSSVREIIYVDIDDLSWRNTILAHEFEHLLHNARDPFEYAWIDEGNADMAAFLCFGASNTIIGHANQGQPMPVHPFDGGTSDWLTMVPDSCSCSS